MIVTFKVYNKEETKSFRITIERNQILLSNDRGNLYTSSDDLFKVLQNAYDEKMFIGME